MTNRKYKALVEVMSDPGCAPVVVVMGTVAVCYAAGFVSWIFQGDTKDVAPADPVNVSERQGPQGPAKIVKEVKTAHKIWRAVYDVFDEEPND